MKQGMLERLFSIENKVVVVTGGGGAIAGALAQSAARCGAKIAVLDLDEQKADEVASQIIAHNGQAMALPCDVLNREFLSECCDQIVDRFGRIDGLINGAGGNQKEATTSDDNSFFDIPAAAHKFVFELNFLGTFLPCQIFGQEIARQKSGSIINIASIAGLQPLRRAAAYAGAKAAVINFTKWLAVHMCQEYSTKIRVNAIAPGFCATDQNRYLLFTENQQLTERSEMILTQVPQNRFGKPEELSSAAIWLLSDSASFVTGSTITIDGGFDAFSGV